MSVNSTKDAWLALKRAYADGGPLRRLYLLRKLFNVKITSFNTIEEHLNEIVGIIMLAGLTEAYKSLVMFDDKIMQVNAWPLSFQSTKLFSLPATETASVAEPRPAVPAYPAVGTPKSVSTSIPRRDYSAAVMQVPANKNQPESGLLQKG
uniref:Uncharacterized protein n=1 Tax=Heliothis virescens TaxID=7102 RepID=A0A2A4JW52_HELVI